jgi:hypothetical protein
MLSAALPVAGWPIVACAGGYGGCCARYGKSCHKARHFAPAAAAGDRYFAEQHPHARGGIVLIHVRHPQPLHDAATNATAEHNNSPTSTQMTEWLQRPGASSQILLHRALARTTVTATGTGRGRLSRVTNSSASGLPIATQSPSITLVYRARAKLVI